jgi:hypothetical protein
MRKWFYLFCIFINYFKLSVMQVGWPLVSFLVNMRRLFPISMRN